MSILNYLEYQTYRVNRKKYPDISPENYSMLFELWEDFEKLYQKQLKKERKNEKN